jgi:hypothetical protein
VAEALHERDLALERVPDLPVLVELGARAVPALLQVDQLHREDTRAAAVHGLVHVRERALAEHVREVVGRVHAHCWRAGRQPEHEACREDG